MSSGKIHNLYGLVLMGGTSQRMGTDKAMLVYDKIPQYRRIYELLSPYCDEVFLSFKDERNSDLPFITDAKKYEGTGPIAGLLSAFEKTRSCWMVVAIDYPLFQKNDLEKLVLERDSDCIATVYYNPETHFYEPFLAIYESTSYNLILEEIKSGNYSLQNILNKNNVKKVSPFNAQNIRSVDDEAERKRITDQIRK